MSETIDPELLEQNARLDAREVLRQMGYSADALAVEGDEIRVFCPIHKDQVRRSLLIDASENAYRCQYRQCPARDGGPLAQLFALHAGLTLDEALRRLTGEGVEDEEAALLRQADERIEALDYDAGLALLRKARELNPLNVITRCKYASLLLERGQRDEGFREYLAAAEDYGVRGELDKTLSIYNLLIILSPRDVRVRRSLALLFSRLGRPTDAAEHLKWAVDQYLASGETREAAGVCEQMIELTPDEPMAHWLLGDIREKEGAVEAAVERWETAARLLDRRDESDRARELVIRGLRLMPGHRGLAELRDAFDERQRTEQVAAPESGPTEAAASEENDGDFADWIASLEEEIEKPVALGPDSVDISPDDARVLMCRAQLESLDDQRIESMRAFLRDMFQDVKQQYESGAIPPSEHRVIREFYKSFCVAFEQIRRERGMAG